MNFLKTVVLLTVLSVLLVLCGSAIGGARGAMFAFAFALIFNFGAYWFSDKIVLGMYRAREVTPQEAPHLYRMVKELSIGANIPPPKVYFIPAETPNAFATGRSPRHAAVAVTEGIMRVLDYEELKGVLAHELAHVKNRDTLLATIAASIAGAITMLAHIGRWALIFGGGSRRRDGGSALTMLLMVILAPLAALVVQMAISRSREYAADRRGAHFVGSGRPLARALEKLESAARSRRFKANPSTASLFIVNPLRGRGLLEMFSTHPPTEKRIQRLLALDF